MATLGTPLLIFSGNAPPDIIILSNFDGLTSLRRFSANFLICNLAYDLGWVETHFLQKGRPVEILPFDISAAIPFCLEEKTAEAAQHFSVSERTIRRWIKDGKLRAEWAGGQWAVRLDERTSESPSVRGDDRADGRLAEQRQSDIDHLQVELKGRDSQLQ